MEIFKKFESWLMFYNEFSFNKEQLIKRILNE